MKTVLPSHQFDIRNFIDRLTPSKGKNRYICPSCQGNNLTIATETGEYKCWNGCECSDIRESVSPWAEVTGKSDRTRKFNSQTPAPIPEGTIELAKLPSPTLHPEKRKRGNWIEIEYRYSDTQWVSRVEKPNPEKPKGYEKRTIPYHINAEGEPTKGKGNTAWNPYRIDEVQAHGIGKWVLGGEGESCVEAGRFLELVSFTLQGSAWSEDNLTRAMLQCKTAGVAGVAYLPDNDGTGYKKARDMAAAAAKAQLPFIQLDPLALWSDMPEKGDIADWTRWGMEQGWNKEEFVRRLEEQFNAAADSAREQSKHIVHAAVDGKTSDPDERLKLELKELLKETDPIKRVRRRAEIASHYRLKIADIEQALKHLDERSKSRQPRRMGLDELFDLPQVGIEYVIPGMLPIGETALLVAGPKAGKSLLAYDAAFAVATGEDRFLGEQVKQGRVLIIQCDESVNTARGRLIKRGFRHEDAANVQFVDSFKITQLDLLEEWLESFRPTLVIVDSLRRINAGRELSENSAEFADAVYQLKELIARYNTAAILIHHTSKNQEAVGVDRVRGSSAIAGAVWGVWQLDHIVKPDPHNKRRMIVDPKDPTRILSIMARDVEGQRLKIELDPENNHWLTLGEVGVEEGEIKERKTHEDEILGLLKPIAPKALEASEINAKLNIGRGVYNCLHRLLAKGIIGSRPSTIDRRRTVYYYPKNDDGDTPPSLPPTPTDQNVIEYAETLTTQALENRSQIDHKSITKKTPKKPVNASKPELASAPEVDHRNRSQGGERGSAATDSPLAKGQWRMVRTNTGLREGKLIECLGDSWRVKVGMNNLVIPTSHIGNLTS